MIKDQPIFSVKWIPVEKVFANNYNPNSVATQEMKLLYRSVKAEFTDWIDDELLHELDMLNTDFDLASIGFEAMYEPVFQSFSNAPEEQESVPQINSAEAEKERRKKYMDFLSQFVPEESSVQITTQDAIRKAQAAQENIPAPKARYSKVVCEHCGHVMFIREGDAVFVEQ